MLVTEPGMARIQVAATLRRMREQAGVTREQAAEVIYSTTAKIGDMERGRSSVKPLDLEKLLDLYGVEGADRELLEQTARSARRRRRGAEPSIQLADQRLVDLELQARSLTFYSAEVLPGFLQTDDYVRGLIEWSTGFTDAEVDARLTVRAARRRIISRTEPAPPNCWCIVGEAALRANVGGPAVMAAQLEHVIEVTATLPHVVVQVLPLGSGGHWLMGLTHTLMTFDPPATPILYADTLSRGVFSDGPNEIELASTGFDRLRAKALDLAPSREVVWRLAREYREMSGDGSPG